MVGNCSKNNGRDFEVFVILILMREVSTCEYSAIQCASLITTRYVEIELKFNHWFDSGASGFQNSDSVSRVYFFKMGPYNLNFMFSQLVALTESVRWDWEWSRTVQGSHWGRTITVTYGWVPLTQTHSVDGSDWWPALWLTVTDSDNLPDYATLPRPRSTGSLWFSADINANSLRTVSASKCWRQQKDLYLGAQQVIGILPDSELASTLYSMFIQYTDVNPKLQLRLGRPASYMDLV